MTENMSEDAMEHRPSANIHLKASASVATRIRLFVDTAGTLTVRPSHTGTLCHSIVGPHVPSRTFVSETLELVHSSVLFDNGKMLRSDSSRIYSSYFLLNQWLQE